MSATLDIILNDGLTGPARAMDAALGRLDDSLGGINAGLRTIDAGMGRLQAEIAGALAPLRSLDAGMTRLEQTLKASSIASVELQGSMVKLGAEHVKLQRELLTEMRMERTLGDARHAHMVLALSDMSKMQSAQKKLNSEVRGSDKEGGFWSGLNSTLGGGLLNGLGKLHPALQAIGMVTKFAADAFFALSAASFATLGGFAKLAIGHTEFKKNTLSQLELIEGSEAAARKQYAFMKEIADRTPFESEQVIPAVMRFRQTGMGNDDIRRLFFAISDAAGTDVFKANTMVEQLLQMRSRGKVTMEDLKPILSASGMNAEDIFGKGGSGTGMSYEEFLSRFTHAVNRVKDKGGGLGSQMDILGVGSLSGQFSTLKSNFGELLSDVNLEPITSFFRSLNDLLGENSSTARELKEAFNDVFNDTIGSFFKDYVGKDGLGRLKDDIRQAIPQIKEFANAMMQIAEATITLAEMLPDAVTGVRTGLGEVRHPVEFAKIMWGGVTGNGASRSSFEAVAGKRAIDRIVREGRASSWEDPNFRLHHVVDDETGSPLLWRQMPGERKPRVVTEDEFQQAQRRDEFNWLVRQQLSGATSAEREAQQSLLERNSDGGNVVGIANGKAVVAAPGEGLASVGPGETILSANDSRAITVHIETHVHTGNTSDDAESIGDQVSRVVLSILDGALLQAGVTAP